MRIFGLIIGITIITLDILSYSIEGTGISDSLWIVGTLLVWGYIYTEK